MWVARWGFISLILCACLGAAQAILMAETIKETSKLRLMPMTKLPVERAGQWTPPTERLADVVDEITRLYGKEMAWAYLMQQAARVKHSEG